MTMTHTSTRGAPSTEEPCVLEEIFGSDAAAVQVRSREPGHQLACRGVATRLGALTVGSMWSGDLTLRRTAMAGVDSPVARVCLSLKVSGEGLISQHGRQVMLGPSDMTLFSSMESFELRTARNSHQHVFQLPLDHLALPARMVNQVTARRLPPRDPLVALAGVYLGRLAATAAHLQHPATEAAGQAGIELIRALVSDLLADAAEPEDGAAQVLGTRVVKYLMTHWSEPDISAARIAAAHHISVRQVYYLLSEAQISLGDWVRTKRLEACRRDLAGPAARQVTIAAVGRRWGFPNATHFGRAFKAAYGITPQDWRAQHQPAIRATGV